MSRSRELARLMRELRAEGITDPKVLEAMERVPRELFVPQELRHHSLRNIPLSIGHGQTISQPFVVALMTQAPSLTGTERVLEVGTGSGYQCAILAELAGSVVSIERIEPLASTARELLTRLGYLNIQVVVGDGSRGYAELAPYDAIVVTAASPGVPQPLVDQLVDGGRLIVPVGSRFSQQLTLYVKRAGKLIPHRLGPVRFVPLIGESAWNDRVVGTFLHDCWWEEV